MTIKKLGRSWDSSLMSLTFSKRCPFCQDWLIPTRYRLYDDNQNTNTAIEYWCGNDKKIFAFWEQNQLPPFKVFAKDFIQSGQLLVVNDTPILYTEKLGELIDSSHLCDGGPGILTGNMFYDSNPLKWYVEHWCDYEQELFKTGSPKMVQVLEAVAREFAFDPSNYKF